MPVDPIGETSSPGHQHDLPDTTPGGPISRNRHMIHCKRRFIAALIAAVLLTVTAASGVVIAHDGPSFGADASASIRPRPTPKVEPTGAPPVGPTIDCSRPPAAAASGPWADVCSLERLKKLALAQVDALVKRLKTLDGVVARSSLSDADKAQLRSEIARVIAQLRDLRAKIEAETTIAGVQADLVRVRQMAKLVRAIGLQVRGILGSVQVLAEVRKLDAQAAELQARILAAPPGVNTRLAQRYLNDMKARIADARALAGPIREKLLGLTLVQLQSGQANPTLAAALRALHKANLDIWRAKLDARIIVWLLEGKPSVDARSPNPRPTPVPTSEVSAVPAA
jgi:hypothetical protein